MVTLPEPRGFRKLAKISIVSLGSGSAPPSSRVPGQLGGCCAGYLPQRTKAEGLTLAQTKTHGSSGTGRATGCPGCPLGVKYSL